MNRGQNKKSFNEILNRIEAKEASARRRLLLMTLIPAVAGAVLLGGALGVVSNSAERVRALREQEAVLEDRLASTEDALRGTRETLSRVRDELTGAREAIRFVQQGVNLFHAGHYAEAVLAYESALELDPENPYVANLKGYALLRADRPEESVETLRRAVAIDPGYAWGHFDLARALCAAGRFDEAATAARQAVRRRPELQQTMAADGEFRSLCEPILDGILPK